MTDVKALERQIIEFMEDLEEAGKDAASVYEEASSHAGTLTDQGTPEMKRLMVVIEDWIAENF